MKTLFTLLFALACTVGVFAQTPATAPPAGVGKIGVVNPILFQDPKQGAGITRLKAAVKTVADATKPLADRIQADIAKYRGLAAEIERLRTTAGTTQAALQTKVVEAQDLETLIKRNEEDYKTNLDKLNSERVSPILTDIFRAMNEYCKAKGYAIVLNGPKLEQDDILMGFDDRYDVTADFITFFNARPAPR
jgi:Skp family chaperone for outer membrane proteins